MYRISFLSWMLFIGMFISDSLSENKHSGVTFDRCRLQDSVAHSEYFIGLTRVNVTLKERPQSIDNGQLLCSIHSGNKDQNSPRYIVLDMFLNGDPPSELSLQMADKFLADLQFSTIVCSYTDIGSESRINNTMSVKSSNTSENGNYVCDKMRTRIIFTGIPVEFLPDSEHERLKRSVAQKETLVPEIKCSNVTVKLDKPFKFLGDLCKVEYGIAFRWMFNSSGLPDCLTCCKDHYYDDETHQGCEKCSPETTQPKMNVWPHCEPAYEESTTTTLKPGMGISLPTPVPLSPVSSTQLPSSKPIENPEPKIMPPAEAPTGIVVTKAGYDFALIEWDTTPSQENAPVSSYLVTIENLEVQFPPVEGSKTWFKLPDLVSGSSYQVKVQAGNSAGYGQASDSIDVLTLRKLTELQDIRYNRTDSLVTFNWTTKQGDENLTAKVEYWKSDDPPENARTNAKPNSKGEIDFLLPSYGMFNVRVFYTNEVGDGPKSEVFTVNYQETDHCPPGCTVAWCAVGWCATAAMVVLFIVLYRDKIKKIVERCCSNGYSAPP